MTKMTVLHFASPFAFSMPLPVKAVDAARKEADEARKEQEDARDGPQSATTPSGDTTVRRVLGTESVLWLANAGALPSGRSDDGEQSVHDVVRKRYRAQDDAGDESDTMASAMDGARSDRVPPS